MPITFKVCDKKEKKVTLNDFSINQFIKDDVKKLNPRENKSDKVYYDAIKQGKSKQEASKIYKEFSEKEKELYEKKIEDICNSKKVLKSSFVGEPSGDCDGGGLKSVGLNGFVHSAWKAYNNHHSLVLRCDNIWMAILTQFSFYVNKNSEQLRTNFVDFNGEKTLVVRTEFPILTAPFDKLSIEMSKEIQKNIKDPGLRNWIIPNFTTTTDSDKVVFSISLMSIMKKYFKFVMQTECGLPEVTLLGEISDWVNLKERVSLLIHFDTEKNQMSKWLKYLLPIMDKFIESANGNPDIKWWNQMVNYNEQSGGSELSGWLSSFCLFTNDGDFQERSLMDYFPFPIVDGYNIPNGFLSAPIKLIDYDLSEYNSQIYAGHLGAKIHDTKIMPSLDWFLVADIV
ncbi:hypothetical protein DDB_G0279971 [Dictyostelium discoideum AX4]|uniref:DUF4419 domain-containing protein n=1 Tax=Dictyostelium discoideum TaxID=44689 RepID=Q54W10_DICDI|nr:hypothetical protein DDB_G0279971 [Dictyostelium discoideum AX4]EAL67457.1 hypothetical protein DDB_G0279971 [Dictyostelium discoideum AX4]|eukprot:XP_641440.1 hypothetical protein DDB_G0279971 [Dictyostelium discoideum AX4]